MFGSNISANILDQMYNVNYNPYQTRSKRRDAIPLNNMTHRAEWERILWKITLEKLAARFEWKGLPDSMPPFYIEKTLANKGLALLFDDPLYGTCAGEGTLQSELNHYGEPIKYRVVSLISEMNKTYDLNQDKAVLIRNNLDGTGEWDILAPYIRDMAEIRVTQALNLQTMKTPFMVEGDQQTRNSFIHQLNQIQMGQTHLFIDKRMKDGLNVLNLDTPYHLDKLEELFLARKNEMMEILGIQSNPNPKKKERMITSEVETNDEETEFNLQTRLALREHAVKEWNKRTGQNISVSLSEVFNDDDAEFSSSLDSAGYDDGSRSGMGGEET